MTLVDRIDDFGRAGWIAITVLSFVIFWPFGFVVLGFLLGSGRMGCWHNHGDRWERRAYRMQRGADRMQRGIDRMQEGLQRMQAAAERWRGFYQAGPGQNSSGHRAGPSGNHAFDEYRSETLRRLEDEQREFMEFLDRLRHAKDKAEFDQFMAERRAYRDAPPPGPQSPPPAV
jgi:uncharacterized protein DUF2852